jgi:hypothetical protein
MHNNMQIFYRVPARERDRGGEREGERERERERERESHARSQQKDLGSRLLFPTFYLSRTYLL